MSAAHSTMHRRKACMPELLRSLAMHGLEPLRGDVATILGPPGCTFPLNTPPHHPCTRSGTSAPPSCCIRPHHGGCTRDQRGRSGLQGGGGAIGRAGLWLHHLPVSVGSLITRCQQYSSIYNAPPLCWALRPIYSSYGFISSPRGLNLVACIAVNEPGCMTATPPFFSTRILTRMPNISARMVPILQSFCNEHLAPKAGQQEVA